MNKKVTILIVVIVAIAALFLLRGGSGSGLKSLANISSVGVTEAAFGNMVPRFDFGTVSMAAGRVGHDFVLVNNSDSDITISRTETSCMCTEAVLILSGGKEVGPFSMPGHGFSPSISETVKSGEKLTVRVIFDPAAHGPSGIGPTERAIMLTTDKGQYQLGFKATVIP